MIKTWITRALLFFAIFTLGFGVGKEVGLRKGAAAASTPVAVAGQDRVLVYYLHATFRCVTCNTIEQRTKAILEDEFGELFAAGRIKWLEADFQEREDLARKYDVASSTVVVVRISDGKEAGFQRLDDVWTLIDKPDEFDAYVSQAIRRYLSDDGTAEPKSGGE